MLPNTPHIAEFFHRLGHRPMLLARKPVKGPETQTVLWDIDDPVDHAAGLAYDHHSVFCNLNPLRSDLQGKQFRGLADWMIEKRTRILIDVDGHGESKETAWAQTRQIREAIAGGMLGEPELPIIETDSGNGFALIYECDMPNDEPSKRAVKRLLTDLKARWSCVDTTVSNAGRYTRVAGTLNKRNGERILTKLLNYEAES
jgi:hypothetical protein